MPISVESPLVPKLKAAHAVAAAAAVIVVLFLGN